jgi:hypothetical protein
VLSAIALADGGTVTVAPAPPPPPPTPTNPTPTGTAAAPGGGGVNALGETLQQAEQAVLGLVASGLTGAAALALHPLPPGTSTADALAFLAELPQTTYTGTGTDGIVTGQPLDPGPLQAVEDAQAAVEETSLQAYKPAGIVAQWRNLIDVFKVAAPSRQNTISGMFDSPKEFFK